MTYEEFAHLLWEKQSIKGKCQGHDVCVLLENSHVYVKGPIGHPIAVFSSLSEALDGWCMNETRDSLSEIVKTSSPRQWKKDAKFADIAYLDPELCAVSAQICRNSHASDIDAESDSFENDYIKAREKLSKCLYGVSLDMRIYHTLPWFRLKEMLANNQIFLNNPLTYNDKWEAFLLSEAGRKSLKKDGMAFGVSCWSAREESEGLWNNCTRGSHASDTHEEKRSELELQKVKIETTIEGLLNMVRNNFDESNFGKECCVGRVKYHDEFYLRMYKKNTLKHLARYDPDAFVQACLQSLFMKRLPFDYEQEIRLVVRNPKDAESDGNGFYLRCSPARFIHEVVVNPNCTPEDYETIKRELAENWKIEYVRKSNLANVCPKGV